MEDYAQLTYSPELAADCSQTSSSDTGQCSPSSGKNPVADSWKDGTLTAAAVGAGHKRDRWWLLAANLDGHQQLEQERQRREEWGWSGNTIETSAHSLQRGQQAFWRCEGHTENNVSPTRGDETFATDIAVIGCRSRWTKFKGQSGKLQTDWCFISPADALRQRLQIATQRGGLSKASAETIQAAAGYTGTYSWSPPDAGICGMVDGVATQMDGCTKGARVKACGNGQVPIQAAAAWLMLSR